MYQRQLGKKGHSDGLFHSPEGIAADEHYIYICDTGNDRVQVRLTVIYLTGLM